jgi:hypothetical protein
MIAAGGYVRKLHLRIGIVAALLAVLAVVFAGLWIARVAVVAWHWQITVGLPLERDLGFEHGTPYLDSGGSAVEVVAVESVVPGGVFDRAGLKSGDVFPGMTVDELFQQLHDSRGGTVTLRVLSGGAAPLDRRPERAISFVVPDGR